MMHYSNLFIKIEKGKIEAISKVIRSNNGEEKSPWISLSNYYNA